MNKSKNRTDFPEMAKVIDVFKKQFPGLKVLYVREKDQELGRR